MMPMPDLASVVARLEQENRNLVKRVEKLEKQRGSSLAALLANVLLLVTAGLLADYLGLFPSQVERLPIQARSVASEEFIVRTREGQTRARLVADEKGFRVLDASGKLLPVRGQ